MKKCYLLLFVLMFSYGSVLAQDTTVVHHAPFQTDNQSLWRQGATGVVDIDIPFFDLGWNEGGSYGGITTIAGFPFGAEFNAGTWGAIGSGLRIEFGNERVDIDYTADISLNMPASGQFEKGQEITINTSYLPDAAGCQILPDTYNIVFQIWMAMGFGFEIGGEFCFFDCFDATIIDINMPVDTFDIVYVSNLTGISLLDGMYEWPVGDYFPFTYQDDKEIIDLMIDLPTNGGAFSTLQGNTLISRIPPDLYASIYFDIPKFIGALNIPYVSAFFANLHNEWELGPITIGYILMKTGFFIGLYHNQTLTFTPNIKTTLAFPGNIDYKVLNPSNTILATGTASSVTMDVGNKLRFRYPCNYEFMDIDPYYYMRNNFRNRTYDSIAFDFVFQMLEFHISMDDIEVIPEICIPIYVPCGPWYCYVCDWCHEGDLCTPAVVFHGFSWSVGPLVDLQPNLFNVKYNWVDSNWEMLGFNSIDPPTFRIRPAKFDVVVTPVAAACHGQASGSASAVVSHGTPPYRYEWSVGSPHVSSLTTDAISNLPAGTHYLIVTDANNCVTFTSFDITEPAAELAIEAIVTDVSCHATPTGSIQVNTSGGTTPYTFAWSNGQTTEDISGLVDGAYTLTVTDANGCTAIETWIVNEPLLLSSTASSVNVNCFGDAGGSASVTTTGGTTPYQYLWSNGDTTFNTDSLVAGPYSVTVTDFNGCTNVLNFTIVQPAAPLTLGVSISDALCNGEQSGSIQIAAAGGTGPYSFVWYREGQLLNHSMADISNISAGNYQVVVTDQHGCTADTTISVQEPPAMVYSISTIDNLCFGESNGSVTLNVSGGTAGYSFNWSNGASSQNIATLPAGNYAVTITDANGCTLTASTYISEPGAPLSASIEPVPVLCYGFTTGSATLLVNGGTSPYAFSWSNGSTSQNLNNIGAGTYTVTITDNNGCVAYTGTVISQPADSLAVSISTVEPSCYGFSDGSLTLSASGGTTPYYLRWDDTDFLMQNNGHEVTKLPSGYYQVIVTDYNGCQYAETIFVDQPDSLNTSVISTITSCFGGNDGTISTSTIGGILPYTWLWSNGAVSDDVSGLTSGWYVLTVTDAHGCEDVENYFVGTMSEVTVTPSVIPVSCSDNTDGSISVVADGGTGNYSYLWSSGDITPLITQLAPGEYTLTVTDDNGCQKVYQYELPESLNDCINIPSSFTPNGDGTNDVWVIRNIDLYDGHFVKIFNRWGNLLYEGAPYTQPWDGKFNGKPLPAETYYYVIDLNNGQEAFTGTVTIIR